MENEWMNNKDAAKLLGVSTVTVLSWCKIYDNTFAKRIGRNYRINRHECLRILRDGSMPPLRKIEPEIEEVHENEQQAPLFR
jgi:hypothetical protein